MTIYYVNDGGDNTDGLTLAKAKTTLAAGVALLAAGDDLYIGMDHAETPTGTQTYTFPGTNAAPNRVISINTTTEVYDKADNIQVDIADAAADLNINGVVQFYGVSLRVNDNILLDTNGDVLLFDDCELELTSAGAFIWLGASATVNVLFKNTNINFSGGGAGAGFSFNFVSVCKWVGGSVLWTGTQPTQLLDSFNSAGYLVNMQVSGMDLSAITSALVDVAAGAIVGEFHNCLLNASVALVSGAMDDPTTRILFSGCDDATGNDLYRLDYHTFYGDVFHDDAIFRTAGAADPAGTNISWKMVSNANAAEFSEPLVAPPMAAWVDSTGSKTFTVHGVWDSATNIQNDEIWLEVEYLEAAADTDSAFADDAPADVLAAPADQAASTEAWTGTGGFTNENKFKLDVTATVNRVGPVIVRVHLAKPSTTVYVDPKIEIA